MQHARVASGTVAATGPRKSQYNQYIPSTAHYTHALAGASTLSGRAQGLTLVHFSAQPEPLLTQHTP